VSAAFAARAAAASAAATATDARRSGALEAPFTDDEFLTEKLRPPPRPKRPRKAKLPPGDGGGGGGASSEAEADAYESKAASDAAMRDDVAAEESGGGGRAGDAEEEEDEDEADMRFIMPKSYRVDLNVGRNPVYVVVTAENGETKTTVIKVTRKEWEPEGWRDMLEPIPEEDAAAAAASSDLDDAMTNREKFQWCEMGAQRGITQAMYKLALMYANEEGYPEVRVGEGSERWERMDEKQALLFHFHWLVKAANRKHVGAQVRLARIFEFDAVDREWLKIKYLQPELNFDYVQGETYPDGTRKEPQIINYEGEFWRAKAGGRALTAGPRAADNLAIAAEWYQRAAELGDSHSSQKVRRAVRGAAGPRGRGAAGAGSPASRAAGRVLPGGQGSQVALPLRGLLAHAQRRARRGGGEPRGRVLQGAGGGGQLERGAAAGQDVRGRLRRGDGL
jgi:TPR repeat protein